MQKEESRVVGGASLDVGDVYTGWEGYVLVKLLWISHIAGAGSGLNCITIFVGKEENRF